MFAAHSRLCLAANWAKECLLPSPARWTVGSQRDANRLQLQQCHFFLFRTWEQTLQTACCLRDDPSMLMYIQPKSRPISIGVTFPYFLFMDVHVKHGSSFKLWHQCRYKASDCFKHSVSERFFLSVKEHWEGMMLIWSSHSHGLKGTANQKTAGLKEGWLQAYPVKVESGVCVWATGRQEVDKAVFIWLIFSSVVIYSRHWFFWALLHFQSSHSWVCCGLEALIILKVLTTSIKSLCRTNPPSLPSSLPVLLLLFKSERTVR